MVRSDLSLNLRPFSDQAAQHPRVNDETDVALVGRARSGDFAAFEILFERHRNLVYRYAYQMAHKRDDAEDIVQEVFVKAYQNLHRYRDEAKFTTWLLRITANLGTDRARMSQRRQNLEQQEATGALSWMTMGSPAEDPVENLEQARRRAILRQAIAELPEHHRNAILFRDIEELDYDDIANFFKCSVGGAKLRVLRARRALRDRVAPLIAAELAPDAAPDPKPPPLKTNADLDKNPKPQIRQTQCPPPRKILKKTAPGPAPSPSRRSTSSSPESSKSPKTTSPPTPRPTKKPTSTLS